MIVLVVLVGGCTRRIAGTPVTSPSGTSGLATVTATPTAPSPATVTATATVTSTTTEVQGQRAVLDRHAVEATIEQAGYTGVVCNHGVDPEVEIGGTFTCVDDGGKLFTVTITSASGDYTWIPN
jgi:septal ring-binding cell division protein DamX